MILGEERKLELDSEISERLKDFRISQRGTLPASRSTLFLQASMANAYTHLFYRWLNLRFAAGGFYETE